jgi:hypothetical protein
MSFLLIPIQTYPNTSLGYSSLSNLTSGTSNTAFGYESLKNVTTGFENVAVGNLSLRNINTGYGNTAVGNLAISTGTSITNSTAVGAEAMRLSIVGANNNTAIGNSALRNTLTGANNTAVGYSAGYLISTGSKNTVLGAYSGNQGGLDIRTLSNYIVISDGDGNPRIWVDNTGQVNFPGGSVLPGGTANGVLYLNGSKVVTSGSALTFDGTTLQVGNVYGSTIVFPRFSDNILALCVRSVSSVNEIEMRNNSGGAQNYFKAGNGYLAFGAESSEQMRLTSTGLGIGTNNPGKKLDIADGQIRVTNSGAINPSLTLRGNGSGASGFEIGQTYNAQTLFVYDNAATATRLTIDSSGNLGLGTVPGAYASAAKVLDFTYPNFGMDANGSGFMSFNARNSTGSTWVYKTDDNASRFEANPDGSFRWYTAGVTPGTAGNAISFTQALTLTTESNLKLGGTANRATTAGTNHLDIFNGTAPVGTLADGISIYSNAGEAYVMDAAGNATLFSPHDAETNEWIFRSKHTPTGKVLKIDVERLLRFVNDHFGLDAVQEFVEA